MCISGVVNEWRRGATWDKRRLVDMQTAGRWADPKMPAHYARAELAERGAVARFFYGSLAGK